MATENAKYWDWEFFGESWGTFEQFQRRWRNAALLVRFQIPGFMMRSGDEKKVTAEDYQRLLLILVSVLKENSPAAKETQRRLDACQNWGESEFEEIDSGSVKKLWSSFWRDLKLLVKPDDSAQYWVSLFGDLKAAGDIKGTFLLLERLFAELERAQHEKAMEAGGPERACDPASHSRERKDWRGDIYSRLNDFYEVEIERLPGRDLRFVLAKLLKEARVSQDEDSNRKPEVEDENSDESDVNVEELIENLEQLLEA